MKKIIFVLLLFISACGDNNFQDQKYQIGIGLRDFSTQQKMLQECNINEISILKGTGIFYPDLGNVYMPPVLEVTAEHKSIICYEKIGSYDYVISLTP